MSRLFTVSAKTMDDKIYIYIYKVIKTVISYFARRTVVRNQSGFNSDV